MSIRAIIVDDEPLALEGLSLRLSQYPSVEVVAECRNGEEAIRESQRLQPDVVFLDLEMPGLSGLEVVHALQSDDMPQIVFVTAYEKFALAAFELHAVDYILKPASLERIHLCLDRVHEMKQKNMAGEHKQKLMEVLSQVSGADVHAIESFLEGNEEIPIAEKTEHLAIKTNGKKAVLVPLKDIKWVDAAGDYMCIHTPEETHVIRSTLKKLESKLDNNFLRIHKSTLVNITYIVEIEPHTNGESVLILNEGTRLKVSRKFRANVVDFLKTKML